MLPVSIKVPDFARAWEKIKTMAPKRPKVPRLIPIKDMPIFSIEEYANSLF